MSARDDELHQGLFSIPAPLPASLIWKAWVFDLQDRAARRVTPLDFPNGGKQPTG